MARVSFAGLSRLVEDRARLVAAFPKSIGVAVSVLVPLVVLISLLAPEIIEVVYGDKWLPATTPLRFLVVLGGLRIVTDLLLDLSIADGRPSMALKVRTLWLVVLIPALTLGAHLRRPSGRRHGPRRRRRLRGAPAAGARRPPLRHHRRRRSPARSPRPLLAGAVAAVAIDGWPELVSGDLLRLVVGGALGCLAYLAALRAEEPTCTLGARAGAPRRCAAGERAPISCFGRHADRAAPSPPPADPIRARWPGPAAAARAQVTAAEPGPARPHRRRPSVCLRRRSDHCPTIARQGDRWTLHHVRPRGTRAA